jgi:hypothetical protein
LGGSRLLEYRIHQQAPDQYLGLSLVWLDRHKIAQRSQAMSRRGWVQGSHVDICSGFGWELGSGEQQVAQSHPGVQVVLQVIDHAHFNIGQELVCKQGSRWLG